MNMIDRIRQRRRISRQNQLLQHAWEKAPTPHGRDEINLFSQRKVF